ncbi:RDD family protein [Kitasatospora sp. NPDC059673]|uniref:RDD family protein n=1 Tax=Kitasatospora sp. NPDC059673 TaxID=3346901 RepID=UPI003694ABCD
MSYPPDPNNPYGQQPAQPGYGYPQQPPQQPGYGYPQAQVPPQPGYGYGYPQMPGTIQANNGYINIANLGMVRVATMGQRFLARLLDGLISSVVVGIAMALGLAGALGFTDGASKTCTGYGTAAYQACVNERAQASTGAAAALFGMVAVVAIFNLLYEWLMISFAGATLGKMALGLRVVKENTGQNPGAGAGFVRFIIPQVGYFLCGIGMLLVFLSPFFDNSGKLQGWHDRAAGTLVIKK